MHGQCDGQRPICENCHGSTVTCTYRDEVELSNDSRKLLLEVIGILNNIPAGEAIRTLRSLRAETNAPMALSTLRAQVTTREHHPLTIDSTPPKDNPDYFELAVHNPIAYPGIPAQVNPHDPENRSPPSQHHLPTPK